MFYKVEYVMKKWMEKEYSSWVYYDDEDGMIIGSTFKYGNSGSIWGAKVTNENQDKVLGQFIDSDFARRAVENYWDMMSRTLLEHK